MQTIKFFNIVKNYSQLSAESEAAWISILSEKFYKKDENFVSIGETPQRVAFVCEGLFLQSYIADTGESSIKYFFMEDRFAGSMGATLGQTPSQFEIKAIEDSHVLEYDFLEFKKLTEKFSDIARFYIRYMEKHWIIEKEPLEVSFRQDTAKTRYDEFLKKYPMLVKRLKKHHIASYLGITPTQMSRLFFSNK